MFLILGILRWLKYHKLTTWHDNSFSYCNTLRSILQLIDLSYLLYYLSTFHTYDNIWPQHMTTDCYGYQMMFHDFHAQNPFLWTFPHRLTGWYRSSHQVKVGHLWPSAAGGMLIIIDGPKKALDVILFNFLLEMWEQSLVGNQSNLMTILFFINVTSPLDIATSLLQNPLRLNLHCLVALLKETTLSVRERLTYYRRTAKSPLAEPRSWS